MGLLDQFLGTLGLQAPNLDDPKTLGLLTAGLQMMSPTQVKMGAGGQVAQGLLGGVQAYGVGRQAQLKQEADERANRASDLQQLSGAYNVLKQQEFARMLQAKNAGQPYTPNPMMPQMEARMAQLVMAPNMMGKSAPSSAPNAPIPAGAPLFGQPAQSAPQNAGAGAISPSIPSTTAPPTSAPDASGLGGPAGGLPMEAWLAMDPTGAKYMEQIAKDNQPIPLRQGDLVGRVNGKMTSLFQQPQMVPGVIPRRDANGQVIAAQEIPGFAPAVSNIKSQEVGATETAKAPFDMKMITNASGATVPMSVAQLMGGGGGPGGRASMPSQPNVASLTVTEPSKQLQGDPWADIPKRPMPSGIGQTTYDAERQKKYAEQASALSDSLGSASDAANQRVAFNNEAIRVLKSANTGTLAQQISGVGKMLISMGVPERLVNSAGMDPTATDELNKFLINSATQKAKSIYGPRLAQQEVMMQVNQASPSLGMTKAAIQTLLNIDNTMAGYTIKQANDFGGYDAKGGDPSRFMAWYARKFPLAKELDLTQNPSPQQQPQSSAVRRYNPQTGRIE